MVRNDYLHAVLEQTGKQVRRGRRPRKYDRAAGAAVRFIVSEKVATRL